MTRNLYVGFDVSTLLGAGTPTDFVARATAGWLAVEDSLPALRVEAWADESAEAEPDVVGLQEAALYRIDVPADGPLSPAETVRYDFVQLLLVELAESGLDYGSRRSCAGADTEAPTALGLTFG